MSQITLGWTMQALWQQENRLSGPCFLKRENLKNENQRPSHAKEEEEEVRSIFQRITLMDGSPTFCPPKIALLCFSASDGQESPREQGLPPSMCGARGPPSWSTSSRHLAKMAQRSPGKGPCCRGRQKPLETLASPACGEKSLPPRSCRAREAIFVVCEQQAVTWPKRT